LSIRPIYPHKDTRIEAHIFVAFMAYCLQVTLKHRLRALAPGLAPRAVLEKFTAMQMVDVHPPTTNGRYLIPCHATRNLMRISASFIPDEDGVTSTTTSQNHIDCYPHHLTKKSSL
jgi:hypothetical protein